jgi:hypothetical protein
MASNQNSKAEILIAHAVVSAFPDSGHHYEFVPLPPDKCSTQLIAHCNSDSAPWIAHATKSWIRYRLGSRRFEQRDEIGVWLAIESNLGDPSRGFVYEPFEHIPARPLKPADEVSPSPYPFHSLSEIGDQRIVEVVVPILDEGNGGRIEVQVQVEWLKPNAEKSINVDLVVDFGNTRTVALLLENDASDRPFQEVCQPVRFTRRGTNHDSFEGMESGEDPCAIVDSWIVLHETVFAEFWPPRSGFMPVTLNTVEELEEGFWRTRTVKRITGTTRYVPQMFVELSPTIIGGGNGTDSARQILNDANLEEGAFFFLSSPKRYAWDRNLVAHDGGQYWNVVLNRWNPTRAQKLRSQLPRLEGPILMFMDTDGRHWEIASPPNERTDLAQRPRSAAPPTHPRSDSLTWAGLTVLETAYRQIMSNRYRLQVGGPSIERRLRSILVTFPSGWTKEELDRYREQWQKAVNIFTLAHLKDRRSTKEGGDRPELVMNLDEAVASQLPLIYSEVHSFVRGTNWLELVGRGHGTEACARVMNIDIGGGTTDVAVVDYRDGGVMQTKLEASLLFKNSSTVAGDLLVKRIIERVLLPNLGTAAGFSANQRIAFQRLFGERPQAWTSKVPALRQKLGRVVRLVFVPIVNHWLGSLGSTGSARTQAWDQALSQIRDSAEQQLVRQEAVDMLNQLVKTFVLGGEDRDVLGYDAPLSGKIEHLHDCVQEVFHHLFDVLARLVVAFECDLVFVSGKPSEIDDIQGMLQNILPLPATRILFAKDFEVGEWYPMGARDGKIHDAKSPTVVGAALAQAMRGNRIKNWMVKTKSQPILTQNYWGLMPEPDKDHSGFDSAILLKPGEPKCQRTLFTDSFIGRKRYLSPHLTADQIYHLRWMDRSREKAELLVVLERHVVDPKAKKGNEDAIEDGEVSEMLRLVSVQNADPHGPAISEQDVILDVCTLRDGEFWMDNPRFEIEWPDSDS